MKQLRLLLADDHRLLLDGICKLLEDEPYRVNAVEDGQALLAEAERLQPDIVVLDISMPLLNGIDTARRLRKIAPRTKIIFLTMHADQTYVREAFRAGAMGYLLKRSAASELRVAIREVAMGRAYVSPRVTKTLLDFMDEPTRSAMEGGDLTTRQREVLQLIAEGRTNKEIASVMNISVKTVEFHKSRVMKELGLYTTAELTVYAIRHGLIGGG